MPFNNIEKFYFGDLGKSSYEIRAELVHSPEHYTKGDIECIDAMKAMLTQEEFVGWYGVERGIDWWLEGLKFVFRYLIKYFFVA